MEQNKQQETIDILEKTVIVWRASYRTMYDQYQALSVQANRWYECYQDMVKQHQALLNESDQQKDIIQGLEATLCQYEQTHEINEQRYLRQEQRYHSALATIAALRKELDADDVSLRANCQRAINAADLEVQKCKKLIGEYEEQLAKADQRVLDVAASTKKERDDYRAAAVMWKDRAIAAEREVNRKYDNLVDDTLEALIDLAEMEIETLERASDVMTDDSAHAIDHHVSGMQHVLNLAQSWISKKGG